MEQKEQQKKINACLDKWKNVYEYIASKETMQSYTELFRQIKAQK